MSRDIAGGLWGYTRRAAIRPNKHQAFPRENTRIGARMRLVTGQPAGFTPPRLPKMGRSGNFGLQSIQESGSAMYGMFLIMFVRDANRRASPPPCEHFPDQ